MSTENQGVGAPSTIGADVEVIGQIRSASPIRIDGKVEGEVLVQGDVTLGKTARIKGNLTVNSISISGTVQGNITARDKIEMKSTAKVLGDIKAKRLAVEDGVTFIGKSEVNPAGPSAMPGEAPVASPEQPRAPQK